jgi:membrane protease YdiL (CAAX protease family)
MLAITIILILSWAVLRFGGENLSVLGLFPTRRKGLQILVGFLPAALLAGSYFLIILLALDAKVTVNEAYSGLEFANGFWWTLRSVLYEELLFRGALLVLAIKYLGAVRGLILSSVVFGVYHWFSYNVIGDVVQMINTFLLTGAGGLAFAYAFLKTRSLYLPVGLHFGWNLITIAIFSQGPLGEQLLISSTENTLNGWWGLFSFSYQIILMPLLTYLCIKFLNSKKLIRPEDNPKELNFVMPSRFLNK